MNRTVLRNAVRYVEHDLRRCEADNSRAVAFDAHVKSLVQFLSQNYRDAHRAVHAARLIPRPMHCAVDGHTVESLRYYGRIFAKELDDKDIITTDMVVAGEKVTHPDFMNRDWVIVTGVGEDFFMGRRRVDGNLRANEQMYPLDGKWTTAKY